MLLAGVNGVLQYLVVKSELRLMRFASVTVFWRKNRPGLRSSLLAEMRRKDSQNDFVPVLRNMSVSAGRDGEVSVCVEGGFWRQTVCFGAGATDAGSRRDAVEFNKHEMWP